MKCIIFQPMQYSSKKPVNRAINISTVISNYFKLCIMFIYINNIYYNI